MFLKDLIQDIYTERIDDRFVDMEILSICSDSRMAEENSLFVAVNGADRDGNVFIKDAIEKGAKVIIKDKFFVLDNSGKVCVLEVDDTREVLTKLLLCFYGYSSDKIKTVGITGTNGKTTITYILESIFGHKNKNAGVIGTVNHRFCNEIISAKNTTPGIVDNHKLLAQMLDRDIEYCFMEVSSHALSQNRVDGISFDVGVFTNLTSDHLDYHKCVEDYFHSKSLLFSGLKDDALALINIDDPYGKKLVSLSKGKVQTYGIENNADIMAKDIVLSLSGSSFVLVVGEEEIEISTKLIGKHNVYNILGAVGVCLCEGLTLNDIKEGVGALMTVPGRLQNVSCVQDFYIFIDYAHTEDALKNVLSSIKEVCPGKIILVFGCGGNRDQEKRPKMGKVAVEMADSVIVTNDNPRQEVPRLIIDQILEGIAKDNYTVVMDRADAIYLAIDIAKPGDVVLVAGKGHEDYQIFKDETIRFDEIEIIKKYLRAL